ncbi:hypothetical protein CHS0354_009921 [Potamilus streckersoni]|uniref:Uncharacterized protein n=1 Tax=Potamilus streckersoni TaxID=2493646 RepID=A0AAE0TCS1_9BIVA|nr:hypothetical protein CHS0354_009921 [Potamilus streckersoni]
MFFLQTSLHRRCAVRSVVCLLLYRPILRNAACIHSPDVAEAAKAPLAEDGEHTVHTGMFHNLSVGNFVRPQEADEFPFMACVWDCVQGIVGDKGLGCIQLMIVLNPTLQMFLLVSDDYTRLRLERGGLEGWGTCRSFVALSVVRAAVGAVISDGEEDAVQFCTPCDDEV